MPNGWGIDLCFQHFEKSYSHWIVCINQLLAVLYYVKMRGHLLLVVGVRKITNETAELKRMWVQLPFQHHGIGQELLNKALDLARICKYTYIRLDTLRHMKPAIGLYMKNGFL
jgi:GNAT superfamily N-acetyltransferase